VRTSLGGVAAIHDIALKRSCLPRVFPSIHEPFEILEEVFIDGGSRLDLHGCQLRALFHEEVDFRTTGFPVMEKVGLGSAVRAGLIDFRYDPVFKDGPPQRMQAKLIRLPDAR